jgi:hypothetical protein
VPRTPEIGLAAADGEALLPSLISSRDVLVGFVVEMRPWAETAIELAAWGHEVSVQGIVETIRNAIAIAEQS